MYKCINCGEVLAAHELRCSFCPHCDRLLEVTKVHDVTVIRGTYDVPKTTYSIGD